MPSGQFSIQHNLGQAMILHPGDMPCPAKLHLQQSGIGTGNLCLLKDFKVDDSCSNGCVEDCVEAALVEVFKEMQMVIVGDP